MTIDTTETQKVAPKVAPWLRNLPNRLTWLRIGCIPAVVLLMLESEEARSGLPNTHVPTNLEIAAGLVFAFASITDFFDGWIARRFQLESLFGKLLDPLADKLLVVSALIILVEKHRLEGWLAVLLITRDLGINAIRLAAIEENIIISSNWIGKTKTAFLDVGIGCLAVYGTLWGIPFDSIGRVSTWLALAASLVSGAQYLVDYARQAK